MAQLKPKKFGYVVQPPPPPQFNASCPAMPAPPPGISTSDWIAYINSYIDVRARQLYDKLKGLYQQVVSDSDDNTIHNHILLRDLTTGETKKVYISNDELFSETYNS
jgi:hypothetical protein